ncbi:DUF971 domain-containing protein [Gammaproteobacteria bacterium]|nr:DUF971 domain-containing protein [Gammaproteobacteria bacterium]
MINNNAPSVVEITVHKKSRTLEIKFEDNKTFIFSFAKLRASSLSADMKDKKVSPDNFSKVNILSIEPVGNYAIKPVFSDGHRTGIFSFGMLYELGLKQLELN